MRWFIASRHQAILCDRAILWQPWIILYPSQNNRSLFIYCFFFVFLKSATFHLFTLILVIWNLFYWWWWWLIMFHPRQRKKCVSASQVTQHTILPLSFVMHLNHWSGFFSSNCGSFKRDDKKRTGWKWQGASVWGNELSNTLIWVPCGQWAHFYYHCDTATAHPHQPP